MKIKRFYKFIIDLIFPNRCPCCNEIIRWDKLICDKCISEFPIISEEICIKCGKTNCLCSSKRSYDYCVCPTYYEGIIKKGILNLKIHNGINFAEYFSGEILKKLNESGLSEKIDYVTAVPMTKEKLCERGYNQAFELAKILSKQIRKPAVNILLKRSNNKISQHELSSEERAKSVIKTYFFVENKLNIKGKTILLCDDVITTSSTLNECARVLKQNGAEKVICAVIATTNLKK